MFDNQSLRPMLLKEVKAPFQDKNYFYELKFDGYRVLIYASKDKFEIRSRNGNDITYLYPELQSIQKLVKNKKVIFDGEVVALDKGVPSFQLLQSRSHIKSKAKIKEMMDLIPVEFICFDIIYQDRELINLELVKRKKILEKYPDTEVFIKSKIYMQGVKLFDNIKKIDLEGIVAKKKDSLYIPGKRVDTWLKIKNFKVEEFYIHGYVFNKNKYSLLLGEYRDKQLYYVGKVSVLPSNEVLKKVLKEKKYHNIFENWEEKANYIKPIYQIKVHYIQRTNQNTLRQPFIK